MNALTRRVKHIVSCVDHFARFAGGIALRSYQLEPLNAIIDSVKKQDGETYVLIFSRQSGKDEGLANLETYLLTLYSHRDTSIVFASPTFKPQTENAMRRLEARMTRNIITRGKWKRRSGYIYLLGLASVLFFSADPAANVVGATASLLLIVNEAQDVLISVYDKRFAPMAAANNAVRVFCGTAWTSGTLLDREMKQALQREKEDGKRRVFMVNAEEVAAIHPPYGEFVKNEITRLGRNHPLIKTQYYNETIDAEASMFNPGRRALMLGDQPAQAQPAAGLIYAFQIDVAGQDEARMNLSEDAPLANPGRDAVSLTITCVDLSELETMQAPIFRAVQREQWIGTNHLKLFGALSSLIDAWQPQYIVMDATGVGEGLWAMLDHRYPGRVIPVKFTQQVKSDLGYRFLAIVETGRFRDCCLTDDVRAEYDACRSEILPGPAKSMRWGVPAGARSPAGDLLHDDYVLADALVAELDRLDWQVTGPTTVVNGLDPLPGMSKNF